MEYSEAVEENEKSLYQLISSDFKAILLSRKKKVADMKKCTLMDEWIKNVYIQ